MIELMGYVQLPLDCHFCDAIRVLWARDLCFRHRDLAATIDCNRRGEHKALHRPLVHSSIDEIHAANEVVFVVELLDEVAQSFRGVCRQMEHILELMVAEKPIDKAAVHNTALDKLGLRVDILDPATTQIVKHHNVVPAPNQLIDNVGANEPGAAGHKVASHLPALRWEDVADKEKVPSDIVYDVTQSLFLLLNRLSQVPYQHSPNLAHGPPRLRDVLQDIEHSHGIEVAIRERKALTSSGDKPGATRFPGGSRYRN